MKKVYLLTESYGEYSDVTIYDDKKEADKEARKLGKIYMDFDKEVELLDEEFNLKQTYLRYLNKEHQDRFDEIAKRYQDIDETFDIFNTHYFEVSEIDFHCKKLGG